jgi:EAL domain-containing protein (putative c-di-GMP-specific phosphodiesterase class I)
VPLADAGSQPARYELLLRLLDEDGDLLMPAASIPAAERFGLMAEIDRWVIETGLRAYAEEEATFSINLSGNSLNDDTLAPFLEDRFRESSVAPQRVCFEITETAAIHDLSGTIHLMEQIKNQGSQLALDDFGSGLSSYRYLKGLLGNCLKIDGSCVKDLVGSPQDAAIVSAINEIAQPMGPRTTAGYPWCDEVVERLRSLGDDYAQGFAAGKTGTRPALIAARAGCRRFGSARSTTQPGAARRSGWHLGRNWLRSAGIAGPRSPRGRLVRPCSTGAGAFPARGRARTRTSSPAGTRGVSTGGSP